MILPSYLSEYLKYMSYIQNISNVDYNHHDVPSDVRCRDLYVDRNFFGPVVQGPTGPQGNTGQQ